MYGVLVSVDMPLIEGNPKVKSFVKYVSNENLFSYQTHPCEFLLVTAEEEELENAKELAESVFDERCKFKNIER